jgi:FlaA1/EpsC-like NDP-sugar epimerase
MKVRVSRNLAVILVIDLVLMGISFYLAHLIRFEFDIPERFQASFRYLLPWVLGAKLASFYFFDLYRGMWRYTSLNDLFNVVKAVSAGSLVAVVLVLYLTRFEDVSRSVFILDWCFSIILAASLRLGVRILFEQFTEEVRFPDIFRVLSRIFRRKPVGAKGLLIIGAGDCGEKICREIREDASLSYHVQGFLDDDPAKTGRQIHGAPILGGIDEVLKVVDGLKTDEIIIAIPSLKADRMRQVIALCKQTGIDFKTLPSIGELINGRVSIKLVRDVEYRDLLGREQVMLDKDKIGGYLGGKCVLVTGAAGSIGRGLCTQICGYDPDTLILFEKAESPLYELDLELRCGFPHIRIVPVLGDVSHYRDLAVLFETYRPRIVFHAAAYKHVPMLESHPWKAVENNIAGTENLVQAAVTYPCEKFVFVSTDKAVNPTSVMGASKRVAEIIIQKTSREHKHGPRFIIVRFGNVIGSIGSVIPLFKRQIQQGGPVTVTHPDMTRYFMLISEACQLILQAGAMGEGGEIFVLEMGQPVRIDNMARDLIRFFGHEPDKDIPVVYTGLRPGEKLFEELMTADERVVPTDHSKILVFRSREDNFDALPANLNRLKKAAAAFPAADELKRILRQMVPEYRPHGADGPSAGTETRE